MTTVTYKDFSARTIFRIMGSCLLLWFLFWNPFVLRPRFWTMEVTLRSITLDTTLIGCGIGLILLRKWAALINSALLAYIGVTLISSRPTVPQMCVGLALLASLTLTVRSWRRLTWGYISHDPLLILASAFVSAAIYYLAFTMRSA